MLIDSYHIVSVKDHKDSTKDYNDGKGSVKSIDGISETTPDFQVDVSYMPNGKIIPVDPKGNPIPGAPTPQYPTDPKDPGKVKPNEPIPEVPGYTPEDPTPITPNDPGENTRVVYHANTQTANLRFVDDTDPTNVLDKSESATGASDSGQIKFANGKDDLQYYLNRGYEFVSVTNDTAKVEYDGNYDEAAEHFGNFDHDDNVNQLFTIHLKHGTIPVTPDKPGKPGEPINPNDPRPKDEQPKYPNGTDKDSLQHDVKRTIKYIYSDGSPASESVHDVLHFKETKVIDKVTGEVISDTWEGPKDFITKSSPHISGYTPDRLQVSNKNIGHDHDDIVETVVYTPNSVPPADSEGQGSTPTSDPIPDNPTDPKKPTPDVPNVPDGYEPDNGEDEGDIEIKDNKKDGKTTKTEKNNRGGEVDRGISIDRHTSKKINEVKTDGVSTKIERVKNDVKTLPQTGEKKNIAGLVGLALLATAGLLILGGDKRKNK